MAAIAARPLGGALLVGTALAGCAASPLRDAVHAEAAGQHVEAAAAFETCTKTTGELDCWLGLAELHRPDGPLADCARFRAEAKETRARYGSDDGFIGHHIEQHLSPAAREGRVAASASDWLDLVDADCRARALDHDELRDSRRQDVLDDRCVKASKDDVARVTAEDVPALAASCEQFRGGRAKETGIDRATDQAIGATLAWCALLTLDEAFVEACGREALRPVCPKPDELRKRIRERVKGLVATGGSEDQLKYAKLYLKRWPDGPDAKVMRLARERASLDLALGAEAEQVGKIEQFLADYPESPLREEALEALWKDAQRQDRAARYRELIERYPEAAFVADAKARLAARRK